MAQVKRFLLSRSLNVEPLLSKDLGKVLAGIQVPPSEYDAFDEFLTKLNYTFVEETNNPVYKQYLRAEV